jgi:predicted RNA-binding protein YlxR (DUF448 family)
VRVTSTDDGIEVDGPSDGRGAWLCRATDGATVAAARCVDSALARGGFGRAWRRVVTSADEATLDELLGPRAERDEHPDAH